MSTQFNVQAMVGATESEYLDSEVVGSLVEVRGGMEGGVEFMECAEFVHVGGSGHEFNPPPAVFSLEFFLEVFFVVGGYCGFSDVESCKETPCIGPPGIFRFSLDNDGLVICFGRYAV